MAGLTLKNITKKFSPNVTAVTDVSIEIQDGEFVVLVGPSGCGKSTLLRMIAGLEPVTDGEIVLNNKIINILPPKDRDIAMVFQNYALYPHMNVYDNMAFSLKMRKMPKDEIKTRVSEAANILGLTPYLDRRPKALSGGQLQRVAVGRAIVRKPVLFLFDEPLSNLDAKLRVAMRAELIKLHRNIGITMIYVTHDQTEAMCMGDRLVVLNDGSVQQIASPLEIYNNPANMFVAGFIGSPPMNFLPVTIVAEKDALFFLHEGFNISVPDKMKHDLQAYVASSKKTTMGIRPEHISLVDSDKTVSKKNHIHAQVDIIEPLGNEILVTCRIGEDEIVCRIDPRKKLYPEQDITLVYNEDAIKLFQEETGKRIT